MAEEGQEQSGEASLPPSPQILLSAASPLKQEDVALLGPAQRHLILAAASVIGAADQAETDRREADRLKREQHEQSRKGRKERQAKREQA